VKLRIAGSRAARTGIAWCALGRIAGAQVAGIGVDPHMVVLTAGRPAGEITVLNPHATRAEFSVDLRFGFATTDSAGQLSVELSDGPDSASAAGWIVPYPSRFVLRPGATRTVRLMARPPAELADGEYWARITVHARDVAPPVLPETSRDTAQGAPRNMARNASGPADTTTARVHIAMETATVLPVFFRKGSVATSVIISAASATVNHDTMDVRATLTRGGNGAFLGIAHIVVRDSNDRPIATIHRQLAVYRSMRPRWTIPIPAGAALEGCSVAITLSTDRHDVPRNLLLQAHSVDSVVSATRADAP
jgi:hypothetical protein